MPALPMSKADFYLKYFERIGYEKLVAMLTKFMICTQYIGSIGSCPFDCNFRNIWVWNTWMPDIPVSY